MFTNNARSRVVMPEQNPPPKTWPERYRELLASADLNAESVLSKALLASQDLECPVALSPPIFLSLGQCLNNPELLQQQVQADYANVTDKRTLLTYLSVTHLDLVYAIIAPLILRLFLHGQAPLPDVDRLFLGPAENGKVMSRWFQAASGKQVGVTEFSQGLAQQLSDWYLVFRHKLGISPGAYWSNTGLALSAPFSAVWNTASSEAVCALAQEWLAQFACDAQRFIEWLPTGSNGQRYAIPQRRGCCLKYQLPEGDYCGTCGVYRKARLADLNRPSQTSAPDQWRSEQ